MRGFTVVYIYIQKQKDEDLPGFAEDYLFNFPGKSSRKPGIESASNSV
jgi:hypothetical protein